MAGSEPRTVSLFPQTGKVAVDDWFALMPTLRTPRLTLRKVTRRDAADFFAYASDPEVARYVLWEAHRNLGHTRAVIRQMRREYRLGLPSSYAICLRDAAGNEKMIGTIGFTAWYPDLETVELGYSLGKAYWGQHLATEALQAMVAHCFDTMGLRRVEAMHDAENPVSGRVMANAGMQMEGTLRRRVRNKGEWRTVCLWAMLRDDPRPTAAGQEA